MQMKNILNRLPSRQALRIIRRLRRRHGENPGAFLLREAEAALKSGSTHGAIAALEKFELVAAEIGGENRGLVQLAHSHLRTNSFYQKTVGSIIKLSVTPLNGLLHSLAKRLLNSFLPNGKIQVAKQCYRTCESSRAN
jgi:hypothetical protein